MSDIFTFDDDFVKKELLHVISSMRALRGFTPSIGTSSNNLDTKVEKYLSLYDVHRGINLGNIPEEYKAERAFLGYGLKILGGILNFENLMDSISSVIETDWKAHVELNKAKRYRDHICHPFRVTAIGQWLLHRNDGELLNTLAEEYSEKTADYVKKFNIDFMGFNWSEIIEYAWLACGILHDIAYPLEYQLRAGGRIREVFGDNLMLFEHIEQMFTVDEKQNKLLEKIGMTWFIGRNCNIRERMIGFLENDKFKHAHAVLGPLNQLLTLSNERRLHTLQGLVLQLASNAIISHHDEDDVDIISDPLSLLLFISDNLQMWNRPFFHKKQRENPAEGYSIRPLIECVKFRIIPNGNGYIGCFDMNEKEEDMELLKSEPYKWNFDKFCEPYSRLENLLKAHPILPNIILSAKDCIKSKIFCEHMMGIPSKL